MNPRATGLEGSLALLENVERKVTADQRAARLLRQFAIGVVDEGDAAVGVAQHDQVGLRHGGQRIGHGLHLAGA